LVPGTNVYGASAGEPDLEGPLAKAKRAVPEGYRTVTPSLVQDDTAKAIEWYKRALGAEEISRAVGGDGKVMHSEIRVGDSRVMMNDVMMGVKGPKEMGGSPASLWLFVEDCDAYFNRAVAAGATAIMPLGDMFWGDRFGAILDPFGYRWSFATRKEDLTPDEMQKRQKEWERQTAAQMTGKKP
jgi:PhnB protein